MHAGDRGKWFFESKNRSFFIQHLKLIKKTLFTRPNSLEHKGKFNRPSCAAMVLYKELVLYASNTSFKKILACII